MKRTVVLLVLFLSILVSNTISAQTLYDTYKFTGTIGDAAIVLNFRIPGNMYNWDQGDYYYVQFKKTIEFAGTEQKAGSNEPQKLIERTNGIATGYFIFDSPDYFLMEIITQNKILTGKWYSMDGKKSFKVVLNKAK